MKNNDTFVTTFPLVWIYALIVFGLLFWLVGKTWAMSFLLGAAVSLMAMSMLYKNSARIMKETEDNARKLAMRNYFFRFMFYAIILVTAGLLDTLEILGVAFGLFSFKICLYANMFIFKRGEQSD